MTRLEWATELLSLVREGVLFAVAVAREVSRAMVRRIRSGRVVIRDERGQRGGGVHGP